MKTIARHRVSELALLCAKHRLSGDMQFVGESHWPFDPDRLTAKWHVVIKRPGRPEAFLESDFYQGTGLRSSPTVADVLSCLISDGQSGMMSFSEFCSEFGYDEDSRRAERIWKACQAIAPNVLAFLGDDIEEFSKAEH